MKMTINLSETWEVECFDKFGNLKWKDIIHNLVVDEGIEDNLDQYFNGSSYTAAHYCGLTDSAPSPAAGDTMSSHTGWTEVTAYSEGVRQTVQWGSVSSKSVSNSSNKAVFSINGTTTVGGAMVTTNSTKGGSTGTLYGVGAFSGGDKSLANGDTLNVQITASGSAP